MEAFVPRKAVLLFLTAVVVANCTSFGAALGESTSEQTYRFRQLGLVDFDGNITANITTNTLEDGTVVTDKLGVAILEASIGEDSNLLKESSHSAQWTLGTDVLELSKDGDDDLSAEYELPLAGISGEFGRSNRYHSDFDVDTSGESKRVDAQFDMRPRAYSDIRKETPLGTVEVDVYTGRRPSLGLSAEGDLADDLEEGSGNIYAGYRIPTSMRVDIGEDNTFSARKSLSGGIGASGEYNLSNVDSVAEFDIDTSYDKYSRYRFATSLASLRDALVAYLSNKTGLPLLEPVLPTISPLVQLKSVVSEIEQENSLSLEDGILTGNTDLEIDDEFEFISGGNRVRIETDREGDIKSILGPALAQLELEAFYEVEAESEGAKKNATWEGVVGGELFQKVNLTDGVDAKYELEFGAPSTGSVVGVTPLGDATGSYNSFSPTVGSVGELKLEHDLSSGEFSSGGFLGKPLSAMASLGDGEEITAELNRDAEYQATANFDEDSASFGLSAGASSNMPVGLIEEIGVLIQSFLESLN